MSAEQRIGARGGLHLDTGGVGLVIGAAVPIPFSNIASVGAGAAMTTIQERQTIPFFHRLRRGWASFSGCTAVTPGTDPAVDIRRYHPVPPAVTVEMVSPADPGLVEDGKHGWAQTFVTAAGETTPSPIAWLTVADKSVNGKVRVGLAIGPTGTTQRKLYRTEAAGTALKLTATIANNTAEEYVDNIADASLTTAAPTANTAAATVLSATLKLSVPAATGGDQSLADQPLFFSLAAGVETTEWEPAEYDVRVLSGAASGAVANLKVTLLPEITRY